MKNAPFSISSEFKNQAWKAILSILIFILTYLIIFILAVLLTVACVYGGIYLIINIPSVVGIVFGVGLGSLGLLVLFFLIKFIFKSSTKHSLEHLHEIKEADEPELFNLITETVKEVGTTFPKHVYLSADVNASVFYESSFKSMFLPVRKNLQIGLA